MSDLMTSMSAKRSMKLWDASHLLYVSGTPLVPDKIGPARRNRHLLEQLTRYFNVTAIAVGRLDDSAEIAGWCGCGLRAVHIVPTVREAHEVFIRKMVRTVQQRCDYLAASDRALARAVEDVTRSSTYESSTRGNAEAHDDRTHSISAIVCSHTLLADLRLPEGVPVVVDAHNVEYAVHMRTFRTGGSWLRRVYSLMQYLPTKRAELRCARRSALVLATSENDSQTLRSELGMRNVAVVRNGISLHEFTPRETTSRKPTLIFTGLLSYFPNEDGLRWFISSVLPLIRAQEPRVELVVAGARPPDWLSAFAHLGIRVTGAVPDMRPYFAEAAVAVVPLRIGGGTRVKILEAQAVGVPVVSTTVGAEGLDQLHGTTILLHDDPLAFAGAVLALLREPSRAHTIASEARRHVERHFDWDDIGRNLMEVLSVQVGLRPRLHRGGNS